MQRPIRRRSLIPLAALVALWLASACAVATNPWSAELQGGGEVWVDPRTNRPTVRIDGEERQLWDGIHKLEDGRELRVESGRVIPNKPILEAREPWPAPRVEPERLEGQGETLVGPSPCERLVEKVCGRTGACTDAEACDPARQLRAMERKEQQRAGAPNRTTFTSVKCQEALHDDFFERCDGVAKAPVRPE